jgi:hypothetical protein
LVIVVTPAGSGVTTVTPNNTRAVAFPASGPIVSAHTVPAADPSAQLQAGALSPALNVTFAGTVSVIVTPVAA